MGKSKPIKTRAAASIRAGIIDGRHDAELWGEPQHDGNDSPRWFENRWRLSVVSADPEWMGRAYFDGYDRAYAKLRDARYAALSREERIEAKKIMEHNRLLRWETRDQREMRLLRERVEAAEREVAESRKISAAAAK